MYIEMADAETSLVVVVEPSMVGFDGETKARTIVRSVVFELCNFAAPQIGCT